MKGGFFMKFKTTKKEIMRTGKPVICVGYDNIQHLLTYENPVAYTCGRDGWHCDIYDFNNCYISTGYQPFGTIRPSYDLQQKYDKVAQNILSAHNNRTKQTLVTLLQGFISEVLNND